MTSGTITKLIDWKMMICNFYLLQENGSEGVLNTIHLRPAFVAQKFIDPKGYLQRKLIKESQFSSDKHGNIDFLRLRR